MLCLNLEYNREVPAMHRHWRQNKYSQFQDFALLLVLLYGCSLLRRAQKRMIAINRMIAAREVAVGYA